jgi:N-acetylmuramidase
VRDCGDEASAEGAGSDFVILPGRVASTICAMLRRLIMTSSRIPGPLGFPTALTATDPFALEKAPGLLNRGRWYALTRSNDFQHHLPDPLSAQRQTGWSPPTAGQFSFLFTCGGSPRLGVSDDDYRAAATTLGVEVEAIKAISQVETKQAAFDNIGRPTLLFERHYFHRFTSGQYDASHPMISNPASAGAGEYGPFSCQYRKLEEAYSLDRDAALSSASWGRFQIMGANYHRAGFSTVGTFILAITRSEAAHLTTFVSYVLSHSSMLEALRKKDWVGFAKRFNGPGYQKNDYDRLMQRAYDRLVEARRADVAVSP